MQNLTLSLPPSKSHEMSLVPIELQCNQDSTEGRLRVKLATILDVVKQFNTSKEQWDFYGFGWSQIMQRRQKVLANWARY